MDIRWYDYLVVKDRGPDKRGKALLDNFAGETLSEKRVIALESYASGRSYAVFKNHYELYRYIHSLPADERRMHEVCLGFIAQKPRFDIDIKGSELIDEIYEVWPELKDMEPVEKLQTLGNYVKDQIIDNVVGVLARDGIKIEIDKNIILCSSHKPGEKASYHIIIDGWIHANSDEAGAFYDEVIKYTPQALRTIIARYCDNSIYSQNHLLRLLDNHKFGENRIKIFHPVFTHRGVTYTHRSDIQPKNELHQKIIYFGKTLVCYITGCSYLPIYHIEKNKINFCGEITDEITQQALDMLARHEGVDVGNLPYSVEDVSGGLIKLNRHRPSMCHVCKRAHEVVGPFMFVAGNVVMFNCRLAKKQHIKLGGLRGVHGDALDAVRRFRASGGTTNYEVEIDWSLPKWGEVPGPGFPAGTVPKPRRGAGEPDPNKVKEHKWQKKPKASTSSEPAPYQGPDGNPFPPARKLGPGDNPFPPASRAVLKKSAPSKLGTTPSVMSDSAFTFSMPTTSPTPASSSAPDINRSAAPIVYLTPPRVHVEYPSSSGVVPAPALRSGLCPTPAGIPGPDVSPARSSSPDIPPVQASGSWPIPVRETDHQTTMNAMNRLRNTTTKAQLPTHVKHAISNANRFDSIDSGPSYFTFDSRDRYKI